MVAYTRNWIERTEFAGRWAKSTKISWYEPDFPLTPARMTLQQTGPTSIHALAKQLRRNYSNVHADVTKRIKHDLIHKDGLSTTDLANPPRAAKNPRKVGYIQACPNLERGCCEHGYPDVAALPTRGDDR